MKKLKTIYWIITIVFVAAMLTSTVPSILMLPYSVEHFRDHLGFPAYFLFFTGLTKSLGIIALFIPGFPKVKEWVYAGFTFDLIGAIYSTLAVGDPVTSIIFSSHRPGASERFLLLLHRNSARTIKSYPS